MIDLTAIKDAIKQRSSLDGEWLGTVKDSSDPEGLSRVRVELDDLTKGIPVDDLPWYLLTKVADVQANSACTIPRVNSRVLVKFPNNNIYDGLVTHAIPIKPPAGS